MNLGTPARGLAFVKHIETEETYRGGKIFVPDTARDKIAAQQFIVLAVGGRERCEDDDCRRHHWPAENGDRLHPWTFEPNDWVLARNRSWGPTPDPSVFVIRQSDVLGKFVESAGSGGVSRGLGKQDRPPVKV